VEDYVILSRARDIMILIILFFSSVIFAQNEEKGQSAEAIGTKIRLGLMDLDAFGIDKNAQVKVNEELYKALDEIGFYKIYVQKDLEKAFSGIKQRFPSVCRDPRCVLSVGASLGLDRMVFGNIDKNNNKYGIVLTLLDVQRKQTLEKINIESEPGTPVEDLVKEAVNKLHKIETTQKKTQVHKYFGKEIHNEIQPLYTSGAMLALAAIWAAANGNLVSYKKTGEVEKFELSGKSTSPLINPPFARSAAMGGCYIAVSDDAYGTMYNPAGLSWIGNTDISVGYQYRYELINNFAASFANKATRDFGFGHAIYFNSDYQNLQNELYFLSSYSYKFNQLFSFLRPFSIGACLKIINKNTPPKETGSVSQNTVGAGLDIGFMTEFADNIRFGFVFKDIPALERVKTETSQYINYYPPILLVDGSYQAGYSTFLVCEGQIPLKQDQPWKFAGGIEQEIWQVFLIRAGAKKEVAFDTPWIITAGFGLKINLEAIGVKHIILDGAYEYNTLGLFPVETLSFRVGF